MVVPITSEPAQAQPPDIILMTTESTRIIAHVHKLAARHGLHLSGPVVFNETGLDYRIGFATDTVGRRWVLRIPDATTLRRGSNGKLGSWIL